jgi:N4-gp56 family major capsid protein
MALTNFSRLTTEQKTAWSMEFWHQARNYSFINKFLGNGPNSLVQHITELKRSEKGARAVITLLADLVGDGVAGDRTLEGNEEALQSFDQVIRVDQLRHANRSEGRMADQKSIVNFRKDSRDVLAYWMSDRIDQLAFLTMAGWSYTLNPNGSTRVGSDLPYLEFAADVAAPTSGRVARWDGTNKVLVMNGATSAVTAADTPSYNMLVQLKAQAKADYVRGVRESGGEETYHVFLTPQANAKLKLDPDYLANLRYAASRGTDNALFTGSSVKIDGMYIHEFRHVPNTSGTATKWGAGNLIEGCQMLFTGAQALGMADLGMPEWEEKEFDYGNQPGISVGKMLGFLKPKFNSIYANNTVQDFGVYSVYVAQ